jgi:nicotinate-nucleotide adenylyltransferase
MIKNLRRIGLWGGSFNPPTLAHKSLAEFTFSALNLDIMEWIICPSNPTKDPATIAPFIHRFTMVNALLDDQASMNANDMEERLGYSLTINTVKALRQYYPEDYLFFLMGADNWHSFHEWGGDFKEILDYVSLVIMDRPGSDSLENAPSSRIFADKRVYAPNDLKKSGSWYILDNPNYDMSATQAREALAKGDRPTHILAPQTIEYICQNNLYRKTIA